jgi:hypothetical protein
MPDGSEAHFDEQVQMYWWVSYLLAWLKLTISPNNLLSHPLVSPVNLGSLGGLCPLLIVS